MLKDRKQKEIARLYVLWTGEDDLATKFPRLLALDKRKSCMVAERLTQQGRKWSWKRRPNTQEEIDEFNALEGIINNQRHWTSNDAVKSCLNKDGKFYVSDVRRLIDAVITTPMQNNTIWLYIVPLKINVFIWRVYVGRIPTAEALSKRGISVNNTSCHKCNTCLDEIDHLFAGCNFAKDVLMKIWNWCGITSTTTNPDSIMEIVKYAANWGNCPKKRKILIAIIYGYIWCLWKVRNDKIFNNRCASSNKVVDDIIFVVYNWVKCRGGFGKCDWVIWCCNPLNVI